LSPTFRSDTDRCALCRAEDDLIVISEFGKAVCRKCFPGFVRRRVESLMRRRYMYQRGDTIGVALSGGKDSAALGHILHSLRNRLRIGIVGLHVNMGLGEFSDASEQAAGQLCERLVVRMHTARVADTGVRIEPVGKFHQCSVCGAVRRALLNRLTARLGVRVVATGHSLEDVLQFMLKGILSGRLDAPRPMLEAASHRPRKIKPLYFMPEAATKVYAEMLELPHTEAVCTEFVPASHRFKEVFELLEAHAPMGKMQFAHALLKAMKPAVPEEMARTCAACGEPANATLCPICRLREAQQGIAEQGRERDGE